ncbi:hypothetical protein [Curtobacterium oceanosedimentum]|uniref:hypothetical protein n=1 Tax=Curtobacterium oceanosedimentum TaxID=465820 RepID=UPI001CE091B4|nr:hypothetical protein [Curtobacterium oceanosedimentum]MCA5922802.1 hypothetical protein [Curtobacterium oceanosedimentum]
MRRFIGRIEQFVPLLLKMQEVDFAKAFELDVISLRSGNRERRIRALADVEGMLREGSGTLADRYVTADDGSPDVERSRLFRHLVVRIRSEAAIRRRLRL